MDNFLAWLRRAVLTVVSLGLCLAMTSLARADVIRFSIATAANQADYEMNLQHSQAAVDLQKQAPGVKSVQTVLNPQSLQNGIISTWSTAEQAAAATSTPEYKAIVASNKFIKHEVYVLHVQ
jgi:hypothetical protein